MINFSRSELRSQELRLLSSGREIFVMGNCSNVKVPVKVRKPII